MNEIKTSNERVKLVSCLLFGDGPRNRQEPADKNLSSTSCREELTPAVATYTADDLRELLSLAAANHVIMRAFPGLHRLLRAQDSNLSAWVEDALQQEQARIDHAVSFLSQICETLQSLGDVIVIKSLDHWPDLGSDLDLYTNAPGTDVVRLMLERLKARVEDRSWGDRLANKWNFVIPGLPELIEVHVGRLGQTGEQVAITESLVARAKRVQVGSHTFRVPANEDRLIISTLQRMYRHFYIRLCDVADTAGLIESEAIDYGYLKSLASSAGLWDGVATYLAIVCEYAESYGAEALPLPSFVRNAAHFGNEEIRFRRRFLRVPIFPQAARFYFSEWERLLLDGKFQNTLRLSLLPGLAAAAALELKLTGSDKGIW